MNTLSLSCLISVTDRYGLMREFTLNQFERTVNHCNDIQALRDLCVTLHSTVHITRATLHLTVSSTRVTLHLTV